MELATYLAGRTAGTPADDDTITFIKDGVLYKVSKADLLAGIEGGGVTSVNDKTGAVTLTASDVGADASGAASTAVAAHVAASDPHTQYLTQTEGDARYAAIGSGGGTGVTDGDKGDITVSGGGTVWSIDGKPTGAMVGTTDTQTLSNKTLASPTITGPITASGASITPASAMPALAVDVTKMLNTKSVSSNSTFTFSATPTADTWFGLHLTNTSASPVTVTIPSSWSMARQANITGFVLPGNAEVWLTWRYTGSAYRLYGEPGYIDKLDATAAPTANDDNTDGYGPGSRWVNTNGVTYICLSASTGAAVWQANGGALPSIQFWQETVADGTITLLVKAPFPFTITGVWAKTASGTCTVTAKIGSTAITGGAVNASSTEATATPSAANEVAVGDSVAITISANSSAAGLGVVLSGVRA